VAALLPSTVEVAVKVTVRASGETILTSQVVLSIVPGVRVAPLSVEVQLTADVEVRRIWSLDCTLNEPLPPLATEKPPTATPATDAVKVKLPLGAGGGESPPPPPQPEIVTDNSKARQATIDRTATSQEL
jgi:hypothetical protein